MEPNFSSLPLYITLTSNKKLFKRVLCLSNYLTGVLLSNNVEEKILHGTTTVGIKATDGVVLCADMRASAGYFIANNNTMKIQQIDDHAGMTINLLDFPYYNEPG